MNHTPSSETDLRPRRLSLGSVVASLKICAGRFPDTLVLMCLLACWAIFEIWRDYDDNQLVSENLRIAIWYLLGEGVLLSATIHLWQEFHHKTVQWLRLTQAVGGAVLVADFIYLALNASSLGAAAWVGRMAVTVALLVAFTFAAGARGHQRESWLYTYSLISNFIVCDIIALGMTLAIGAIFFTADALFDINNYKIYPTLLVIGSSLLPATILLGRIPRPSELAENPEQYAPGRFTTGIVKYLLLPLTVIYMAILYLYGLRIIGALELPRGIVSMSVSGAIAAILFTVFLLNGVCRGRDIFSRAALWLPRLALPLLLLMSVAVFHRIAQYGITVPRLYLATFNIWAYAALGWLTVRRGAGFRVVPVSFAALFLLVSVIPGINYSSLTQRYMHNQVMALLSEGGIKSFPASKTEVTAVSRTMEREQWQRVSSLIGCLDKSDDHSAIEDIIDFPARTCSWKVEEPFVNDWETGDDAVLVEIDDNFDLTAHEGIDIPDGFNHVEYDIGNLDSTTADSAGFVLVTLYNGAKVSINIDSIASLGADNIDIRAMRFSISDVNRHNALFVPTSFICRIDSDNNTDHTRVDYLTIRGMIFSNEKE